MQYVTFSLRWCCACRAPTHAWQLIPTAALPYATVRMCAKLPPYAGHRSCVFYFLRDLAAMLGEHDIGGLRNFHLFAKKHLPPSVLDVARRPLHADMMSHDLLQRHVPDASERTKFRATVIEDIDKHNKKYLSSAMDRSGKERCVEILRRLGARHRSADSFDLKHYPQLLLLSHLYAKHNIVAENGAVDSVRSSVAAGQSSADGGSSAQAEKGQPAGEGDGNSDNGSDEGEQVEDSDSCASLDDLNGAAGEPDDIDIDCSE